jgi:ribosomal protein L21E
MKSGDLVLRKWKPKYGTGIVLHVLGETIVVKWILDERPKIIFEKEKHLKKVIKGEV